MRIALLMLALVACGRRDELSTEVRKAVAETRTKPQVAVVMQLEENEKSLQLRQSLERQIEEQHVGLIKNEAAGPGHLDFTVEVDNTVEAIPRIREFLRRADILSKSSIRVLQ